MTVSPATKTQWRAQLTAARKEVTAAQRTLEAAAIAGFARQLVHAGQTVCSYVPVGTEPGSRELLDDLLAMDVQVLLPVVTGAAPLDWAVYDGTLQPGPHRLLEPTGPRLGPAAIASAGLVFVPALAIDQTGVRLGRGAGHYDRSLVLATPQARLVAMVRDQEFLPRLPFDEHDVRMTAVLTPGQGMIELSRS
ncbi:5-formyltetrahydrofolate cyclo-ligase [Kibdelosporangium banguiense]|uniref:5-formyltetrahydrofolate cyclo-ligase n=1 Tax=Kibdelosporangium banguiense TaxID=1365924 RepID=A0ABS4TA73_9PSEU|nr:5-formyltetrahydrofolate cyclo-ligase [Kibdelosporangium banguiense]MBP2321005.1 5-formyltetrahydrofolate cyclo-ligase [Kibdelosporangium banguiense]